MLILMAEQDVKNIGCSLFNTIFLVVAMFFDNLLEITMSGTLYGPLYFLYCLLTFIPSLAVTVRRLHDVGKKWVDVFYCNYPINWTYLALDPSMF